ncbi:MAG TPA: DAK2 domain-containing protein [Dehalococcoidia bacterium]|nr:DAK2 domain-containing protein [Dehalococcoidia bacterium]
MGRPRSRRVDRTAKPRGAIDGPTLARMLEGASDALSAQAAAINAINVFPVPDGDTGTNMSLTLAPAAAAASAAATATEAAHHAAREALMSAKGNSGVILSQILSGMARALDGIEAADARAIAQALAAGREQAYAAVSEPREGTILTCITDAARAAGEHAADSPDAMLAAVVDAARASVARTPDLLPVLREAGVVDSGAQGLLVAFEGMLRGLRGESAPRTGDGLGRIDAGWLAATQRAHGVAEEGFCTEFVVSGDALDVDALRREVRALGTSALVVAGEGLARVHVHTRQPEAALARGRAHGAVSHEKVDDMRAQVARVRAAAPGRAPAMVAVVAVAAGDGFADVFRSIGAAATVAGGQTMNPSAGAIAEAVRAVAARDVIVLPGNRNVVMAAEQAAAAAGDARVHVVPAVSAPQEVAALVAFNPEEALDPNLAAMREAITRVRTAEVTRAVRDTRAGSLAVREGQWIALVDHELTVAADALADAALEAVRQMAAGREDSFVTLYWGAGEDEAGACALAAIVHAECGCEVEVVRGGQPHYPYVIGCE